LRIIVEGAACLHLGGLPIFGFRRPFRMQGRRYARVLPIPVIIMVAVPVLGAFILNSAWMRSKATAASSDNERGARTPGEEETMSVATRPEGGGGPSPARVTFA